MMKNTWQTLAALAAALSLAPLAALHAADAPQPAGKPNVIFFLVDDMGWQETSVPFYTEVTALNRRYQTPNMERLAAEGMKFTQAYACPLCSPTRVSGLTGMNAARHRVTNWTRFKNASVDPAHKRVAPPAWNVNGICMEAGVERTMQVTPLPALLRDAGYRTIHVGKLHVGAKGTPGEKPLNLGFDVNIGGCAIGGPGSYWGEKNFSAAWRTKPPDHFYDVPNLDAYQGQDINVMEALTLEAVKQVEKSLDDKKPFYLYMAQYGVHAPYERDKRFYQKYIDAGMKPFEAMRLSMLEGMDKSLGDLMAALKRLGIANHTIILFMTDNGVPQEFPRNLPLRGHKLNPYEGGIRAPMIVKWPGVTKPGTVCNEPVIIEDYFPTILELAGATGKPMQRVDGISFVPLLRRSGQTPVDRAFVWHFPHVYGQTPYSSIRKGDWKYIFYYDPGVKVRQELFNLREDIGESKNLADANTEKVKELAADLKQYLHNVHAQTPSDKQTGQTISIP